MGYGERVWEKEREEKLWLVCKMSRKIKNMIIY